MHFLKKNTSIFTHDTSTSQQSTFTRVTHKDTAETNNIINEYMLDSAA